MRIREKIKCTGRLRSRLRMNVRGCYRAATVRESVPLRIFSRPPYGRGSERSRERKRQVVVLMNQFVHAPAHILVEVHVKYHG